MASYAVASRLQKLVLDGYLERVIQDAMVPEMRFRELLSPQKLDPGIPSSTQLMTREGIPQGSMVPISGGAPATANYNVERWPVELNDYGQSLPLSLRDNSFAIADMFIRYTRQHTIAGMLSVEGLAANAAYEAAGWGHSFVKTDASSTTSIAVTSLLGLGYKHNGSEFAAVSASNPLAATLVHGGSDVSINIIGATPDDASKPNGSGTITIDAATDVTANDYIHTSQATFIMGPGSKALPDITSSDVLTLQQILTAAAVLKMQGVPTFRDGTYHCHLSQLDMNILMQDSDAKNLLTSNLPLMENRPQVFGKIANVLFVDNESAASARTYPSGGYGTDGNVIPAFFASVPGGVDVATPLLVGADALMEYYRDILNDVYRDNPVLGINPVTKVVTARALSNDGAIVGVNRLFMLYTNPVDKLGDLAYVTWEYFGGIAAGTDFNAKPGPAGSVPYRRLVALPYAA